MVCTVSYTCQDEFACWENLEGTSCRSQSPCFKARPKSHKEEKGHYHESLVQSNTWEFSQQGLETASNKQCDKICCLAGWFMIVLKKRAKNCLCNQFKKYFMFQSFLAGMIFYGLGSLQKTAYHVLGNTVKDLTWRVLYCT